LSSSGSPAPVFALTPGLSTVLPGTGTPTPPPKVAIVQTDGSIKLDFGSLRRAKDETYDDVLRLASQASGTASLSLALSGPIAKLVKHAGYWEGKHSIVSSSLSLKAGQIAQLAFEIYAPAGTALGEQQGTLTITAKLANKTSPQTR
jgi:hypothetical protein